MSGRRRWGRRRRAGQGTGSEGPDRQGRRCGRAARRRCRSQLLGRSPEPEPGQRRDRHDREERQLVLLDRAPGVAAVEEVGRVVGGGGGGRRRGRAADLGPCWPRPLSLRGLALFCRAAAPSEPSPDPASLSPSPPSLRVELDLDVAALIARSLRVLRRCPSRAAGGGRDRRACEHCARPPHRVRPRLITLR
jgi:hypothetical protein